MSILYFVHLIWTSSGQWLSICEIQYINTNSIIWEVIVQYSITVHFWRIFTFSVHFRFSNFQSCISPGINIVCTAGQLAFWRKGLLRLFHTLQLFWWYLELELYEWLEVASCKVSCFRPYALFLFGWRALSRSRGRQGSIMLVDLFFEGIVNWVLLSFTCF